MKPDLAIFHAALEKIHCVPNECFYTDDIATYVQVGRAVGLQAEVFRDVKTLQSHLAERGVNVEI